MILRHKLLLLTMNTAGSTYRPQMIPNKLGMVFTTNTQCWYYSMVAIAINAKHYYQTTIIFLQKDKYRHKSTSLVLKS